MNLARAFSTSMKPTGSRQWSGATLLEVLVAIFIMGIGLLALLTPFPLGALEMARSIQDDRAGHIATAAGTLSEQGEELLARTQSFVIVSALQGSADPKTVLVLRADYADLDAQAAEIEAGLHEIRPLAKTGKARRLVDLLLVQIRSIRLSISAISGLLGQLGGGIPRDQL